MTTLFDDDEDTKRHEIPSEAPYYHKVELATKNIENKIFGRLYELGQRARMVKFIEYLIRSFDRGNFKFWFNNAGNLMVEVKTNDLLRKLKLDPENRYIMDGITQMIFKRGLEVRTKEEDIDKYLEEQLEKEILPDITLKQLIEEELLKDV